MPTQNKQFNVMLDPELRAKLDALADFNHSNVATLLRVLITRAHAHCIEYNYQCPSGALCFVPQMHPRPAPPAPAVGP